ncbi:MAG: bifunctional [glutamate--ammonia ligase]-adenylyl-L-tyrosine phosphorylase/[glutamate--ammonia-ligase] adenylyltransferase [Pseudomonadota bacterium]
MPNALSPVADLSRFYQRWVQADLDRLQAATHIAGSAIDLDLLASMLKAEFREAPPTSAALPGAMRRVRNLLLAALIQRDLECRADLAEVVASMTLFADFAVVTHLAALQEEMATLHGTPIGEESGQPQHLIVLGMGKLGGSELNVSSDIDLIFVYPEDGETALTNATQKSLSNQEFFTRLGKRLIAALSEITSDGFTFRVDMALRPNGHSGPLVASLNMLERYLIVQGREWERYAWVKARALTGQAQDIAALEAITRPFIYRRYLDFGAIDAIRTMHSQIRAEVVRQEIRHPERSDNVKLGRGGIREIEFIAQVFQLIRGGRDAALRERSTRAVLATLGKKNMLTPEIVDALLNAYTFLRNLEHRLQYLDDAQTHTLPANDADRLRVAHMMGFADVPRLLQALEFHKRAVAAQFDEIFSDPHAQSETVEGEPAWKQRAFSVQCMLTDTDPAEVIMARLVDLQFDAAEDAAERLFRTLQSSRMQSLPEASRKKLLALMNAALPSIARLVDNRAATLHRILDFFEAIARRAAYLALLTEYPQALSRVIRMMSASEWAAQYLTRHPLLLDELLDDRTLTATPDWGAFAEDCRIQLNATAGDTERQLDVLRELHHAQQLRLLAQDLEGAVTVEQLADNLSQLADILVAQTVQAIWLTLPTRHLPEPRFAVIAYGKLGGKELGYASDLDLVFLYDDEHPEAPALYARLTQRFITWMTSHTAAGILFDIDTALRPDGASGLLVTSLASFEKYQMRSAWQWEHQALTRARFCAGDPEIGERFEALRLEVLCRERDHDALQRDVLHMRRKLQLAHVNKGPLFDLKHDKGGMIDIEFMVQFLVLRQAVKHPELAADIGNIGLLQRCSVLGLIEPEAARTVADAYRNYRKLQHQIRLQGQERALVDVGRVTTEISAVVRLWDQIFTSA